jgi:hypothetical protein
MDLKCYERELNGFELAVCENQGALLRDCQQDFDVDACDFTEAFMTGPIAASMDNPVSLYHNNGTRQIGTAVLRQRPVKPFCGKLLNPDALYWAGYLYRYWSWWLDARSRDIYSAVTIEEMLAAYGLHTLSPERAIAKLLERNTVSVEVAD